MDPDKYSSIGFAIVITDTDRSPFHTVVGIYLTRVIIYGVLPVKEITLSHLVIGAWGLWDLGDTLCEDIIYLE